MKEISDIFTYKAATYPEATKEQVSEAFKKLAERSFNFGWYIRPDRQGAYHFTGYKIDDPKIHIYRHPLDTPICTVYPERIERHFPHTTNEWSLGFFLAVIQQIQQDADIYFEKNIKPVLYNPDAVQAPAGFCANPTKEKGTE